MNNMKDMGRIIAEKRRQAGLTQEAFADKLGITPQAVSKWENNVGLPDITLLPTISKILNISISDLFSMNEPMSNQIKIPQFPEELDGLSFIFSKGNMACYSSKEVELVDDEGNVRFKDGSVGNLNEGFVVNQGEGEIRFYESDEYIEKDIPGSINETLEEFTSVAMTLSVACTAKILKADDGIPRIQAKGNTKFMKYLKYSVRDGMLAVDINPNENNNNSGSGKNELTIYTNFEKGNDIGITVNGASDVEIETDFTNSKFKINGCGDILAKNTGILEATINGSGNIDMTEAYESAKILVNGSGDLNMYSAKNVNAYVNGCGDICIKYVSGDISTEVNGAGDFTIGGTVDKYNCKVSGSGDIHAKELTVSEANINLSGSSDVTIGRIINYSMEKISKQSTLTVLKRG